MKRCAFVVLWVALCLRANGIVYYVSPNGDDTATGLAANSAWQTLGWSLAKLRPGDTLRVMSGTYFETGMQMQNQAGTASNRIWIIADDPQNPPVIDGQWDGVTTMNADTDTGIRITDCSYVTLSGLKLKNIPKIGISFYGDADELNNHDNAILNCSTEVTGSSGILVRNALNIEVLNCEVRRAVQGLSQECITLNNVDGFLLAHCEVYDRPAESGGGEGIDAKVSCKNGIIRDNYIHQVFGKFGLYIDGFCTFDDSHDIQVLRNVIYECGSGISLATEHGDPSGIYRTYNITYVNNISAASGGAGVYLGKHNQNIIGATHRVEDVGFYHNTVVGNGAKGVHIANPESKNVTFHHNIVAENGSQIVVENDVPAIGFSICSNLVFGYRADEFGGSNIWGDPEFAGGFLAPEKYQISSNSPAVNAAPGSWVTEDYGQNGIYGGIKDIGAYEYDPERNESDKLKVYLVAGAANMDHDISSGALSAYGHGIADWLVSTANRIPFHYWRHDGNQVSDGWSFLDQPDGLGAEHILAYRLWNYWQAVNPGQQIGIIKVSSSLYGRWNPGGRDRSAWVENPAPAWFAQGDMYQVLSNRVQTALSQLTELDVEYEVAGLFLHLGEGDSGSAKGGDNYAVLLEDLLHGWADRNPTEFPNDSPAAYGGSLRELCGLTNLPVVVIRPSWQIKGTKSWGERSAWTSFLSSVRSATMQVAQAHSDSGWVDTDDIPLNSSYQYSDENYIEIAERLAQVWMEQVAPHAEGQPKILSPSAFAEYLPSESSIWFEGEVQDESAALNWSSTENGVFGTEETVRLDQPGWQPRVYSVGDAINTDDWIVQTNYAARITLDAVLTNGFKLSSIQWINRAVDADEDGLPDDWAEHFWPGGGSGGAENDSDEDGLSNLNEWIAGTGPMDSDSFVQLLINGDSLIWDGIASKNYKVLWTPDLALSFTNVAGRVRLSEDAPIQMDLQTGPAGFYKLEVSR